MHGHIRRIGKRAIDAVTRLAAVCWLLVSLPPAAAQDKRIYHEQTGKVGVRVEVWEEKLQYGSVLYTLMDNGEYYAIRNDPSFSTMSFEYRSPSTNTAYSARRTGSTIQLDGTVKGEPVSRTFQIDDRPWYQSIERSFEQHANKPSMTSIEFWIVHPYDVEAHLIVARKTRREIIDAGPLRIDAIRIRVSLPGLASLFWGGSYWYRVGSGTFVKFEGRRGVFGTPKTVLELIEGDKL